MFIRTIGHSNHSAQRLSELLLGAGVRLVADVRRFPHSRRWPQFNQEQMKQLLGENGIDYLWLEDLGGRRRLKHESEDFAGWEQAGFRAYAAHMHSTEFQAALHHLVASATSKPAAVLCAEALWWQCHRRLIADQLLAVGYRVQHIMPDGKLVDHVLTPFAVVHGRFLAYPAPLQRSLFGAG